MANAREVVLVVTKAVAVMHVDLRKFTALIVVPLEREDQTMYGGACQIAGRRVLEIIISP